MQKQKPARQSACLGLCLISALSFRKGQWRSRISQGLSVLLSARVKSVDANWELLIARCSASRLTSPSLSVGSANAWLPMGCAETFAMLLPDNHNEGPRDTLA
jgi:hypothetical protein